MIHSKKITKNISRNLLEREDSFQLDLWDFCKNMPHPVMISDQTPLFPSSLQNSTKTENNEKIMFSSHYKRVTEKQRDDKKKQRNHVTTKNVYIIFQLIMKTGAATRC